MKHVAIVLAAGRGKRMGSDIPKQYLQLGGYPILYYSLKTFEESFLEMNYSILNKSVIGKYQKFSE